MRLTILLVGIMATLALPATATAQLTSMREPLFASTDAARAKADELEARRLAPISYAEAATYYERADANFNRAGSVDAIRRDLTRAEASFNKAAEAAEMARVAFDSTLQARMDALASDAPSYATDHWEAAESSLDEATRRLERGSIRAAERYAKKAQTAYRDGELVAIKANYLSETRELIGQAEDGRAERYAPESLNNARLLLEAAETALNNDRYDTDRPRSLAADAKHNALHAIYVAKLEQRIRDDETSLEAVLLGWEASIERLGDALDTPVYFDHGETQAIDTLLAEVNRISTNERSLSDALRDREAELAAANAQTEKLKELLGGGNQTIAELESLLGEQQKRLAQQARHRERFAAVERLFDPAQATVLRQGNNVIIRLIGLNFDSGQARLTPAHMSLLDSVEQAISEFPESRVVVEGHTDAFGSDDQNQALSQARADAVVKHLLGNLPISPANLSARGYGESRPVANNETAEGRMRNRRIDVVIEPSWLLPTDVAQIDPPAAP